MDGHRGIEGTCRSCRASIFWLKQTKWDAVLDRYVVAAAAKANPIDIAPNVKGNLVLNVAGGIYRIATKEEIETAHRERKNLYLSHFASCEFSARHRKEKQDEAIMFSKRKQRDRANEALYGRLKKKGASA